VAEYAVDFGLSGQVPALVYAAWQDGALTDETLHAVIFDAWQHNHAPTEGIGQRKWVQMFKTAGFVSAYIDEVTLTEKDGTRTAVPPRFEPTIEQPTEPVPVWRGTFTSTGGRGMSWTVHRECALQFAEGYGSYPPYREVGVYRALVRARAVLAAFADEWEQHRSSWSIPTCCEGNAHGKLPRVDHGGFK
jgi:hypothetical protein